jgi:hypothetical protein
MSQQQDTCPDLAVGSILIYLGLQGSRSHQAQTGQRDPEA